MKYLFITLLALISIGASCREIPNPVAPTDSDMCVPAADNLKRLGCTDKLFLENGTPFEIFCVDFQAKGIVINPTCLATVQACSDINTECYNH